jgi:hypothetical protein
MVSLDELLNRGPVAVTFDRGHWCPYCRININSLAQAHKELTADAGQIVAIQDEWRHRLADLRRRLASAILAKPLYEPIHRGGKFRPLSPYRLCKGEKLLAQGHVEIAHAPEHASQQSRNSRGHHCGGPLGGIPWFNCRNRRGHLCRSRPIPHRWWLIARSNFSDLLIAGYFSVQSKPRRVYRRTR